MKTETKKHGGDSDKTATAVAVTPAVKHALAEGLAAFQKMEAANEKYLTTPWNGDVPRSTCEAILAAHEAAQKEWRYKCLELFLTIEVAAKKVAKRKAAKDAVESEVGK